MIKTILGIILLLTPFLFLEKFENKRKGFVTILTLSIAFHTIIAIITQLIGIFNYPSILTINILAGITIILKTNYKKIDNQLTNFKINWPFASAFSIISIMLYHIHYKYTGTVSTLFQLYSPIKNMRYIYPYFSDEWSAISSIKYSILTQKLPLANTLWYNSAFVNYFFAFHSFLSEIIILLNLNPLTNYIQLSFTSAILICLLTYIILREFNVSDFSAAISAIAICYITNGATLPGIWTLIPIILATICFLSSIFFMKTQNTKMILLTGIFTLLFYPPLVIFYIASLGAYLFSIKTEKNKKIKLLLTFGISITIIALFFLLLIYLAFPNKMFEILFSKLFYMSLIDESIPKFTLWKIIPPTVLLLSVFGLFTETKKKTIIIFPIIIGYTYWIIYSFTYWRLVIEYPRIVIITSYLTVILAGFGIDYIIESLKEFEIIKKQNLILLFKIIILVTLLIFSFSYTQRTNWRGLIIENVKTGVIYDPAAPANQYLNQEDLEIFKEITNKNFLSIHWKGTTIGVATDNFPLDTKGATISSRILPYETFMAEDCDGKITLAKDKKIDYVYSTEFTCKRFEFQNKSSEGLYLYKVIPQ